MFVSEYFGLDDELDKMGVFGCVVLCQEKVQIKYALFSVELPC